MCSPVQAWPRADYLAICKRTDETESTSCDIGRLRDHIDCRFGSHQCRRRSHASKGALHAASALTCTSRTCTVTACTGQCHMHGDAARMLAVILRSLLPNSKGCKIGMLHRGERSCSCATCRCKFYATFMQHLRPHSLLTNAAGRE